MTMSALPASYPFRDARSLPRALASVHPGAVSVAVSYRATWNDGLGAGGWKLDANLDDPEIIAVTSVTSGRIPTSVLVHDLLDHLLCGFAASGHRAEGMALGQLARRTGADPTPDYRQMVVEDLLRGHVVGETAQSFVGPALRGYLPPEAADEWDGPTLMGALRARLAEGRLIELLVARLHALGEAGHAHAVAAWGLTGLPYDARGALGLRLQQLLERMDAWVQAEALAEARGEIRIGAHVCELVAQDGRRLAV